MATKTYCDLHSKTLDRKTKNKGIPYHWVEKDITDFSNMCYGKDNPEGEVPMPTEPEPSPIKEESAEEIGSGQGADYHYKEEPKELSEKEKEDAKWERKDRRITRVAIAKSFIYNAIDFDTAKKENDLDKWFDWVWEEKSDEKIQQSD